VRGKKMPTYQYECLDCKHTFEVFQSMSDEPVKTCQKCGKIVRKVYNSAGIIFKGSGFYVNDYKQKSGEPASASPPACQGGCGSCSLAGSE
jgi:putative FmdB family regulatory protein